MRLQVLLWISCVLRSLILMMSPITSCGACLGEIQEHCTPSYLLVVRIFVWMILGITIIEANVAHGS